MSVTATVVPRTHEDNCMKITDITMTEFSLGPLNVPYWNSIIRTESKGFSRVQVHTDEGDR